jgi:hypothetical protein
LALVGHSRGGKQSIHAATLDDRISAVLTFDPVDSLPPFGELSELDYPSVTPELMGDFTVPSGVVGTGYGSEGVNGGPACAPEEDNHQAYYEVMPPGTRRWVLPSAGHNDIVDECAEGTGGFICAACPPGDDPVAVRTMFGGLAVAFLSREMLAATDMNHWLDGTAVSLDGVLAEQR